MTDGDFGRERARRLEVLRRAGVYLVTEESLSAGRRSEEIAEAALEAGVRVIQVREKDGSMRRALEIARAVRGLTRRYDALLIVNDRVDIALAADADGVHLGQEDLPIADARRLLGEASLIGLSITDAAQLSSLDAAMADCLGVGAVFPTGSKTDATLTGLALLAAAGTATAATRAPIVAIGGITLENTGRAVLAGADVVAVISAIAAASDPGLAAAELLEAVRVARAEAARAGVVLRPTGAAR
ncbi:MAG TPA: thiamine phosphate synthase [Candidatus Limnocylindrales bacterium]